VPTFLTAALDGSEYPVSRLCRFTSEERALDTYCIAGWLGSIFRLDAVGEKKNLALPGIETGTDLYSICLFCALLWTSEVCEGRSSFLGSRLQVFYSRIPVSLIDTDLLRLNRLTDEYTECYHSKHTC
jgi:hypothetical protein